MLTINVAPDGSGQFTTISEAVLAVPYDCPAVIRIAPGIYREKLVCEKKDITLAGAGMDATRLVWNDGGKLPHPASPVSPYVTVSGGITTCVPDESTTSMGMVTRADEALYAAKALGRNHFFSYELQVTAKDHLAQR